MKIPETVRVASGYEDDDDFQPNPDALGKLLEGYARQLRKEVRANRCATMYGANGNAWTKRAIWHAAVVATIEDVLALYLHDSPARGNGPHEAKSFESRETPDFDG